jgi:hypothetical protein
MSSAASRTPSHLLSGNHITSQSLLILCVEYLNQKIGHGGWFGGGLLSVWKRSLGGLYLAFGTDVRKKHLLGDQSLLTSHTWL